MTPMDYREALKRLGLSISGAAIKAGYHPRTGYRWVDPRSKGPPQVVALLVKLIERNRYLEVEVLRLHDRVRVLERMDRV